MIIAGGGVAFKAGQALKVHRQLPRRPGRCSISANVMCCLAFVRSFWLVGGGVAPQAGQAVQVHHKSPQQPGRCSSPAGCRALMCQLCNSTRPQQGMTFWAERPTLLFRNQSLQQAGPCFSPACCRLLKGGFSSLHLRTMLAHTATDLRGQPLLHRHIAESINAESLSFSK